MNNKKYKDYYGNTIILIGNYKIYKNKEDKRIYKYIKSLDSYILLYASYIKGDIYKKIQLKKWGVKF